MNLIIDQGNTFCKIALFEKDKIKIQTKVENRRLDDLKTLLQPYVIQKSIVSSVGHLPKLKGLLEELSCSFIQLTHESRLPLALQYETPETLGLDRIAAAIGAWKMSPHSVNLVIDAGTAITYDIITPEQGFIGGNIAPGLDMRLEAMHHFTQGLPLLERGAGEHLFGKNTNEAMRNGAQRGILAEIMHYMEEGKRKYGDVNTFLTGGDASFFEKAIKNSIFVAPNLIMYGLLEILKIN